MRHTFFCIDGHTAGNPVRLVVGGAPLLRGASMGERRQDFMDRFDWIRTGLCFEPRGHDMMSGGFLYPPTQPDSDIGILFIETSGCLPMCGHGTIGIITFGLEHGLITPSSPGTLRVEVPAGLIEIDYTVAGERVTSVRIRNVASYLAARGIAIEVPGFGPLSIDVAYGGNFYAIIEPQGAYAGLDAMSASRLVDLSRTIRAILQAEHVPVHPLDDRIRGVSHVMWTDRPSGAGADGRNAVFYGERAIDRSPCGTGTSARLAQLAATGRLGIGDRFVHESYIGSRFTGRVEQAADLAGTAAIIPSIEGSAVATGFNTLWIDRADPLLAGFLGVVTGVVIRTLSDQLVDLVRDRILSGAVVADRPIRQDALAAELGVSKIPLREALGRLEQEGLVRSHANRGFFVRTLSADEAKEVYQLRLKLEPETMALAAVRATEAERTHAMRTLATMYEVTYEHGAGVGAFNRALHRALYAPSGQPVTVNILDRLQVLSERYVRKHLEPLGRDERANEEHRTIVQAWLGRDACVAELSRAHIAKTLDDLHEQLGRGDREESMA